MAEWYKKCPKCGSKVIQVGGCGHGHCLSCKATWNLKDGKMIEGD